MMDDELRDVLERAWLGGLAGDLGETIAEEPSVLLHARPPSRDEVPEGGGDRRGERWRRMPRPRPCPRRLSTSSRRPRRRLTTDFAPRTARCGASRTS